MKSNSYYNTNKEQGNELKKSEQKAATQEHVILKLYKMNGGSLSASQAWSYYGPVAAPLTSIRRAISNLVSQGYLVRTERMTMGMYGKQEHIYSLKKNGHEPLNCHIAGVDFSDELQALNELGISK